MACRHAVFSLTAQIGDYHKWCAASMMGGTRRTISEHLNKCSWHSTIKAYCKVRWLRVDHVENDPHEGVQQWSSIMPCIQHDLAADPRQSQEVGFLCSPIMTLAVTGLEVHVDSRLQQSISSERWILQTEVCAPLLCIFQRSMAAGLNVKEIVATFFECHTEENGSIVEDTSDISSLIHALPWKHCCVW